MTAAELLAAAVADLVAAAGARRDRTTGTRVTFSPKVFIPLTHLCRDRCGYCTFAQPPARVAAPFLTADEVLGLARAGVAAGCHEALFTLGEAPEDRYPVAREWLRAPATHRPSTTWWRCAGWCSRRRVSSPTPTRGRWVPTTWPGCGRCRRRRG